MSNESSTQVDIIDQLYKDLFPQVAFYLDKTALCKSAGVSKSWHGLFSNGDLWKKKIISELKIDPILLENVVKKYSNTQNIYKQIYLAWANLDKQQNLMLSALFHIYQNPNSRDFFYLLIICLNNYELFKQMIPKEEQILWLHAALLAGCKNIYQSFFNADKSKAELFLKLAAASGNRHALNYLLDEKNQFQFTFLNVRPLMLTPRFVLNCLDKIIKFKCINDQLTHKICCGNLAEVQNLIQQGCVPNQNSVTMAALFGRQDILDFLLDPQYQFNLRVDFFVMAAAIDRGEMYEDAAILEYLLHHPQTKLADSEQEWLFTEKLSKVSKVDLIKQFLASTSFAITPIRLSADFFKEGMPNKAVLEYAILQLNSTLKEANSVQREFLPDANKTLPMLAQEIFQDRGQDSLEYAAYYNYQMLIYLIQNYSLKPTEQTLYQAAQGGNLIAVRYLLDPNNNFLINANKSIIEMLRRSYRYHTLDGISQNIAISIIESDIKVHKGLLHLKQFDMPNTDFYFNGAFAANEEHAKEIIAHAIEHPEQYQLRNPASQYLQELCIKNTPSAQLRARC